MEVLIKTLQVILALSLLVAIHELGHYSFAKLFRTRVEKFYLFFNPKFAIVKFKKIGGKWKCKFFSKNEDDWGNSPENTEYGIGWVPFGGYCKISGMVDETTSAEDLAAEPQPWEFRTKPAWQRFFIMFGGVLFNFILAVILYAGILNAWGEEYLRNEDAVYGICVNNLAREIGFRNGDRILSIDGTEPDNFANLQIDMIRSQATEAIVLRGEDTVCVSIDSKYIPAMLHSPGMFTPAFPFVVAGVPDESINSSSDIASGDRVTAVGDKDMFLVHEVKEELSKHPSEGIRLSLTRGGEQVKTEVQVDSAGMIGVMLDANASDFFNITTKEYGFFSSIPAGAAKMWNTMVNYVKELGLIFSPKTKAYKSVGSFIAIGRIFPATWDWYKFWSISALLSIMLGVINILPIPALDGGHILFLIVEMVTGKKPSDKFLSVAETIGMILLLALMVLAFGNDIKSLF